MEIWKDVINYECIYQISNLGNVKSLDRSVFIGNGFKFVKGKILKQGMSTTGYFNIGLHLNGKRKIKKIHQLVAESFLGHKPDGTLKLVVNHIDFNPLNNNVNNLEVVTQRENANQKHIKSTSKYVGVHLDKERNKWISFIRINNKKIYLGRFTNEIEAHNAYQNALSNI